MLKKILLWLLLFFAVSDAMAHPMPNSVVHLSVLENSISGVAKIPLLELQSAIGEQQYDNLNNLFFKDYFLHHIAVVSGTTKWATNIDSLATIEDNDPIIGKYKEVLVYFTLTPPNANLLRTFTFNYDAVIHQVITHKILVFVHQDWSNGIHGESNAQEIGIIQLDIPSGKIYPLAVSLQKGSWWKGFKSMLHLGMNHIKEGTDHLLFLLVLLLPAMLLINGKRWGKFGGTKYSVVRLLKIVTAFTIGHSITLLIGAMGWLKLPQQPVEVLIAFSILVSAIHAIQPIFPGKETYVAAGFGLIHGLAFASILANLKLGAGTMALSILGFNLGIELMQLFIIAIIVPWLILLSKTVFYDWFRIVAATLAAIAALAWIAERISGNGNIITAFVTKVSEYGLWCIIFLAILSISCYIFSPFKLKIKS
jgi:HupE / UreJ protein